MESWVELENDCPIDIGRIVSYAKSFNSKATPNLSDLDKAKESLLDARGDLDLMTTTLIQTLYDREILVKPQDTVICMWLREDLARFLRRLDEKEDFLLIEGDHKDDSKNRVSISKISSYAKTLKLASTSVIYESLLKATKEYNFFEETDLLKKEKRTFLYILFQILQVTLSVIASQSRDKSTSFKKNDILNQVSPNWNSMMSKDGQENIKDSYKEQIGGSEEKLKMLFDDENEHEQENMEYS